MKILKSTVILMDTDDERQGETATSTFMRRCYKV